MNFAHPVCEWQMEQTTPESKHPNRRQKQMKSQLRIEAPHVGDEDVLKVVHRRGDQQKWSEKERHRPDVSAQAAESGQQKPKPEAVVDAVVGETTRICPVCMSRKHPRVRDHLVMGPFFRQEIGDRFAPGIPFREARISNRKIFNFWPVSLLFRPPGPDMDGNIYMVIPHATCCNPQCSEFNVRRRIQSRVYFRRFSLFRLLIIHLKSYFDHSGVELSKPIR